MTDAEEVAGREDGRGGLEAALSGASSQFRRRFLLVALAAVTLVVAVSALLAWRQYEEQKKRSLAELHARVVLASTVFDTYFAGQLSLLRSVAASPAVVSGDQSAMHAYFMRLETGKAKTFSGGLGWIDRQGVSRVSTTRRTGPPVNVADRSYFKAVITTGAPFVSEGLVSRSSTKRRVVIMSVPTRDAQGRLTGVLAGSLSLRAFTTNPRSADLGFSGLVILDRAHQQLTDPRFAPPENQAILPRLTSRDGVLKDVHGLDGADGHVVAYANSVAPAWTTVIDRPRSAVYAGARRGLIVELAVIGSAMLAVLCIIAWAMLRSRRQQEVERRQIRQWDELAQSLGDASAIAEVTDALGASLVTAFPESLVIVAVREDERPELTITSFRHEGPIRLADDDRSLDGVARLAYDLGDRVAIADAQMLGMLPQELAEATPSTTSLFGLPLLSATGRAIGAVTLLLPGGRVLNDAEELLVTAQAELASRALARAGRHEREHDVATALQQSLLPDVLPAIEGLDLAGRYNAGGVGLAVGGDWYDAVRRDDGIIHLTVGDVAGRGIPAAVLMGQLQNAFRALAYDHDSPAAIARRLTRLVPQDEMATAVFITIDPFAGLLTYASAGHPPSVLLDSETGSVKTLDGAKAPPLGWASADDIVEESLTLPVGSTVLAYTDGLVERRGESIDDGIDRLGELLAGASELTAGDAADRLLDYLVIPLSATDDIALLLVRHVSVPASMAIEIQADPALMRGLRGRLRAWLALRGLDEAQQADAVLAISEACNNAIEHAYADKAGTIRLSLDHRDDTLVLAIEDDGVWRSPRYDPSRGRGTMIMKATMDSATISHNNGSGTRVDLELRLPVSPQIGNPVAGISDRDERTGPEVGNPSGSPR